MLLEALIENGFGTFFAKKEQDTKVEALRYLLWFDRGA
jgi:hypothetical protein